MSGYPQTATNLQSAMAKNKYLKVLVMEGMYDLATPFYASAYTFQHLRLEPDYRKNLTSPISRAATWSITTPWRSRK